MLFGLETDAGDRLVFYVVPDGFSGATSVTLHADGEEIGRFPASETRPALVAVGRHESGLCGYTIDKTMVPGLAAITDLEVREADSGILVYRRLREGMRRNLHLFRLESHLMPLWRLDAALSAPFQYSYRSIEHFGRETCEQLLMLTQTDSVCLSGRLNFRSYEAYLERRGFVFACILNDPYEELAERLLLLNKASRYREIIFGMREEMTFAEAIDFAQSLDFKDPKGLRRAFKTMDDEVVHVLSNPLVRLLSANSPDELPAAAAVALSLDTLSSFAVVGLRTHPDEFVRGLEDLVGFDPMTLPPITSFTATKPLADLLRTIPAAERLIELDLALYDDVVAAIDKARRGDFTL